ncbi:MAG: diguanylate cyclase [Myxococcales bacterium]|nr:diguanylate cyclase [Myxococcales bacterium]
MIELCPPSDPVDAPPAHVLVVDDDRASADVIAQTVSALGHRVTTCNGWTDALRVFGHSDVDLVLMDAIMPGVDGFRLTRLLRARSTSYVPIVFLTGLADRDARERGVSAGADDFLTKPVDPLELKVRLTAMLRIRSLTRDLEARSRALARLATIDALTGVGNRRAFDDMLPKELRAVGVQSRSAALLLLDIDHFKAVNDNFGHPVGDTLLAFLGQLLDQSSGGGTQCFRYGGEEFAILMRDTNATTALELGERIRRAFAKQSANASVAGGCTVSIGVASTEQFPRVPDGVAFIAAADAALYRAKALGRNCVCRYDARMDARVA